MDQPTSGDPIPEGHKRCSVCGVEQPLDDEHFYQNPRARDGHDNKCIPCRKAYSKERGQRPEVKARNRDIASAWRSRNPDKVQANRKRVQDRRRKSGKNAEAARARRQRNRVNGIEVVPFAAICERDEWICHLCLDPVDPNLKWPHPGSQTEEHVIPRARSGPHTWENVKLAHAWCNWWKGDRLMEELDGEKPPPWGTVDPVAFELVALKIREAQSASLKEYYANRADWTPEQLAIFENRNCQVSEGMLGNQRGLGSKGRAGQPWTAEERVAHLAAVALLIEGGEWQAKLKVGQARRRTAEKAGERPMFSEAGLKQSLANLAKGHDVHDKAITRSAEVRRDRVREDANRMWAERAEKGKSGACLQCGGTDSKPLAKGLCTACYMQRPKPAPSEDGSKRRPGIPKLTEESVRIIRAEWAYGKSRELAERFGVSPQLIQEVASGKRWRHVA